MLDVRPTCQNPRESRLLCRMPEAMPPFVVGALRDPRPGGMAHGRWFQWLILLAFACLSPVARAAVPAAPTNCVAAGVDYGSPGNAPVYISWNDNSNNETLWVIEININNAGYAYLPTVTSVTTATTTATTGIRISVPWSYGVAGTAYRFRVFAYNSSGYSAASNEATLTPVLFKLTASAVPCQAAINLSWPDAPIESGYQIWYALHGASQYALLAKVPANTTTYQVVPPEIEPTKTYYFIVRPFFETTVLGESNAASATVDVPANMTSKPGVSGTPGSAFSHTFTHTGGTTVTARALTGTPSGLTFNSGTGALSGVFPAVGNYTLTYAVTFTDGSVLTQTFYIRVRPAAGAPAVGTIIAAWNGMAGDNRDTALAGTFSDPEAESAVRVSTTVGNMDFILFNTATPATVTNFMSYVNEGKYTDVAFHYSSIADHIIQGGGFKGAGSGSQFTSVSTHAPVSNEPGVANARGTLCMVKSNSDPNSATSQFFVNLADNRGTYPVGLDYRTGGYTVFGRVAGNGMAVADAISQLPSGTYSLFLDGSATATPFTFFPMNAASFPSPIDQTKLVKINSVTSVPTLNYGITGNTRPSVATATIDNGRLRLLGLAGGQTTIRVTATDLDNLATTQSVVVNISDTYTTWAARSSFPGGQGGFAQNPDGDAWNNLQEYAFMGDPSVSTPTAQVVYSGLNGAAPSARYMTLTFPVRMSTTGLTYAVEANNGLSGSWTEVWKSTSGFSNPQVVSALNQTDRTVVTIKDTVAFGGRPQRFMRVKIVQE